MKKRVMFIVLGMFIGVVLSVSTPALAKTRTINGVFNKVKTAIEKIEGVQTDVTAVKADVKTVKTSVSTISTDTSYQNNITNDIYDNAYYQSEILNNIAYNSYIACLYSGVDVDTCDSPSDLFINTDNLFDYDISSMSASNMSVDGASVQRSQMSHQDGNAAALKALLENR